MDDRPTEDKGKKVLEVKRGSTRVKMKAADVIAQTSTMISAATHPAHVGKQRGIWPAFPDHFHVIADDKGERVILAERNGVVRPVTGKAVDASVLRYWTDEVMKAGVNIGTQTVKTVRETREYWSIHKQPLNADSIRPVAFASSPGMTYHRLGFDPVWDDGDDIRIRCPKTWDILSRTTNSPALTTWIGSLFDQASPRQQYVWLTGKGRDGKGTLIRKLQRLLGPSFGTEQPPATSDKFWTSGLIGKRLVVFADINDTRFVTSGLFKSLSGEDPIRVEFKGGAIVTMDLNCKYLFSSNNKPGITDNRADMRRIIYCHVEPPTHFFDGDYESEIWDEMPAFVSYCWTRYQAHKKEHGRKPIACDMAEAQDIAGQNTEEFDMILERHFSNTANEGQTPVTAFEVQSVARHYYPHQKRLRDDLCRYIVETVPGVTKGRAYVSGARQRVYEGLYKTDRTPM
ncbi:MAG TPA: DUF5906 domain-containing protein [Desulfosporosinus sp.]|nr:DUF5906 domain-containing protein [Desulfosporosinus sp.]